VSRTDPEYLAKENEQTPLNLYCMGTLLADEASRCGQGAFAESIEKALNDLLGGMSRNEQRSALRLSYELALGSEQPAPPRLRLVYSRD
jgi:hypothetical protein